MVLQALLRSAPDSNFLEQHFLRLPFSLPGGAGEFQSLATWDTISQLLECNGVDILVVKDGLRWPDERLPTPSEFRQLHAEGYTILFRGAERHDPRLAELAAEFRHDLGGVVDIHLYCTPANAHGFGWHYDAEDVFILQTQGSKEYLLRKNTVQPWPLIETLPRDMQYEREIMPVMKCLLHAGDWLYIPNGYWHRAQTREASISLAVGVMMPAAIDLLDMLKPQLRESILWRQRLPSALAVRENSRSVDEPLQALLHDLAADVAARLSEPRVLETIKARLTAS